LKRRFPNLVTPASDDICYATQNRQNMVKLIGQQVDLVLVVGSANSSNSRRLREVAEEAGVRAYLIEDASKIDPAWLEDAHTIGVTAGASAPEHLVQGVIRYFRAAGVTSIEEVEAIEEHVTFSPPAELVREISVQSLANQSTSAPPSS
jgi:4-hydroxy-3-methylbut-2-enyl diphosphate reductase